MDKTTERKLICNPPLKNEGALSFKNDLSLINKWVMSHVDESRHV